MTDSLVIKNEMIYHSLKIIGITNKLDASENDLYTGFNSENNEQSDRKEFDFEGVEYNNDHSI